MLGPKLRSARVDQYKALGEKGRPLYTFAHEILALIERERPDLVSSFAVPQLSDDGSWIDWYAPEPGVVASWGEIMASEQEEARARLVGVRHQINKLQKSLTGGDQEERLCRDMLTWVFHHPDASHRFLINDRPVLAFWGFLHKEARLGLDPLDFSATYYPDFAGSAVHHAVRARSGDSVPWWRRWWLWLWLALLAAVLVSVSVFGLPTIPTDPNTDTVPAAGSQYPTLSPDYDPSLCKKNWGQCANRGWHGGSQ
ncbi:hypothetical protein [Bordetella sp. FB-8]|uniref:hypothetical protein n=1 Tax=Bordetella sp. FB-8 TaxID=1159870 RepID=UPI00039FDF51|nr:hypothetical protein [Bordetella sp. FB-8]